VSATGGMHPFGDAPKSPSSAYRPFLDDRHFNAAISFQIGVVRAPPSAIKIEEGRSSKPCPLDQTARRNFARFGADLSEQQTCLNLNCRLRLRYPAALDAKVARRSSALRCPPRLRALDHEMHQMRSYP
jgi:hypothetical protein